MAPTDTEILSSLEKFNLEDLDRLSFELGIDFENITGSTRDSKARNLILYAKRRGKISQLTSLIDSSRPKLARQRQKLSASYREDKSIRGLVQEAQDSLQKVLKKVIIDEYVQREQLDEAVKTFLSDQSDKYRVLRIFGNTGLGKTTFLAHLAISNPNVCAYVFAENFEGDSKANDAIFSLCAQLIDRFKLDPYFSDDAIPTKESAHSLFDYVIRQAARKLTIGNKLIIVCDALDQAGTVNNGNRFGIPRNFPKGVYFICTERPNPPVHLDLAEDIDYKRIDIVQEGQNEDDLRRYIQDRFTDPSVKQRYKGKFTEKQFVDLLLVRSHGVWVYASLVVRAIRDGSFNQALNTLPDGLTKLYIRFWSAWVSDAKDWDRLHKPIWCALAAAQEPIPLSLLTKWIGSSTDQQLVRNKVLNSYRSYLIVDGRGNTDFRVSLYHSSLRDFITGQIDVTDNLDVYEQNLIDDLSVGVIEAHGRIADYFIHESSRGLSQLVKDDYARRHMIFHHICAQRISEVFKIVTETNEWAEGRFSIEQHFAGYLNDLEQARRLAKTRQLINYQVRCALIESSVRSRSNNVSPELLKQLVAVELMAPDVAMQRIRATAKDGVFRGLITLASSLPYSLQAEVLRLIETIEYPHDRFENLIAIATQIQGPLRREALSSALDLALEQSDGLGNPSDLLQLIPHLSDDLFTKAYEALTHQNLGELSEAVIFLLSFRLPASYVSVDVRDARKLELLPQIIEFLYGEKSIKWLRERINYNPLTGVINSHALSDDVRPLWVQILNVFVDWYREIQPELASDLSFNELEIRRVDTAKVINDLLDKRLQTVPYEAKSTLLALGLRFLPVDLLFTSKYETDSEWQNATGKVLLDAINISDENDRSMLLEVLIDNLPSKISTKPASRFLEMVQRMKNSRSRLKLFGELSKKLPEELRSEALIMAVDAIKDFPSRSFTISDFGGGVQ